LSNPTVLERQLHHNLTRLSKRHTKELLAASLKDKHFHFVIFAKVSGLKRRHAPTNQPFWIMASPMTLSNIGIGEGLLQRRVRYQE
jgi:hypothetical protein